MDPQARCKVGPGINRLIVVCVLAFSCIGQAKPLYILGDIKQYPGRLIVYEVLGPGQVEKTGHYTIPQWAGGAVGIAIDSDTRTLFVTYEDSTYIQLINGRTMKNAGLVEVKAAQNLAGIVYDHHKRLLYCIDRGTGRLHVMQWAPERMQLQVKNGSPFKLESAFGFGIALDEIKDLLYVANGWNNVTVYSTSDWSLVRTITLQRPAISLAIDYHRQVLYTGAGYIGDSWLVRYDLTTGTEDAVEVDPNAGVIGIAVDDMTGLVYVTTGRDQAYGGDDLKVFNSQLEPITSCHLGGNPTGIALPLSEFGLRPLGISKTITVGAYLARGTYYVAPGNFVTYQICVTNTGLNGTVTDIIVEDQLPVELEFFRVEGLTDTQGTYNPTDRKFTYRRASLDPNTTVCFWLTAQVNKATRPGTTITNTAFAKSRQTDTSSAAIEVVTAYRPIELIKVVVPDPNHMVAEGMVYVHPASRLDYQIVVTNPDTNMAIPELMVVDTLPAQVQFVEWQATAGIGLYDPQLHAYTHVISPLPPKTTYLINLWTKVRPDVQAGAIITNKAVVNGLWTVPASAQATATVVYEQLAVGKTIVLPQAQQDGRVMVAAGQAVTYRISVGNIGDAATTNVLLVDVLPAALELVSIGPPGTYNPATRACIWSFPILMPAEQTSVSLVARVKSSVAPGLVVENTAVGSSDQTSATSATIAFTTYLEDVEGTLQLIYSSPACPDCSGMIQAVVTLPAQVKVSDVDPTWPLTMEPGQARSSIQTVSGIDGRVKIRAFFTPGPLLAAVPGYGPITVTVRGRLYSGRAFFAQSTFLVTRTMR